MKVETANIPPEFDRNSTRSDLLEACKSRPLAKYPAPEDRWHISADQWDAMAETGVIVVPDGPWAALDYPAREAAAAQGAVLDPADPDKIDPAQKIAWREEYSIVTDRGLPVHPAAKLGVTTEVYDQENDRLYKLGMATGIGREWHYGAIKTGALLLARLGLSGEIEYPTVTELRGGTLYRGFPGGYAEPDEAIADACIREAQEESGLVEACAAADIPWQAIESLPHNLWRLTPAVIGPCTLNVWLEEHFLAIDATKVSDLRGVVLQSGEPDQIQQTEWYGARELLIDPLLLGAHKRALRAHLAVIASCK